MVTITKSIYGSVVLLKGFCSECRTESFVIDGEYSCCGSKFTKPVDSERIKRETEGEKKRSPISNRIKKDILKMQENKCIYCDCDIVDPVYSIRKGKMILPKVHFDHFVPWIYSQDNNPYNLYASCDICNLIKSDKYFYDLISAREYINEKRKAKGYLQL